MIFLTTGGNGTFKTLLTLKLVRDRQIAESRPVAYNGRFTLTPEGEAFGWKKIDFTKWQDEPDGTIFIVDECHNEFPNRANGSQVPPHINMLSEHRRRGFDFYLCTIHPQNLDVFVRRHVQAPGWHRHHKRFAGAGVVSVLEWATVNPQCDSPNSGKNGTVTTALPDKSVYGWYESSTLHTAQKRVPRAVWVVVAASVLVPVFGYYAFSHFTKRISGAGPLAASKGAPAPMGPRVVAGAPAAVNPVSWFDARIPRVPGLPHTAPAFDELTAPKAIPYPAACIARSKGCACFTSQGTPLNVPTDICVQIARSGYFMEWHVPAGSVVRAEVPLASGRGPVTPVPSVAPAAAAPAFAAYEAPDLAASRGPGLADGRAIAAIKAGRAGRHD